MVFIGEYYYLPILNNGAAPLEYKMFYPPQNVPLKLEKNRTGKHYGS